MAHYADVSWDRMIRAVEKVRERLTRAVRALEGAKIPYAVIGGNAVAAWVARVDEAAVRNTQDVDLLLRRSDFEAAKVAMEAAGFVYRQLKSIDMFLDGPGAKARDAVHVIFAGEKVRPEDALPASGIDEFEQTPDYRLLSLDALVRMELTSNSIDSQVNVRDMLDIGLIDESWVQRYPPQLAERLQHLLDTPDG